MLITKVIVVAIKPELMFIDDSAISNEIILSNFNLSLKAYPPIYRQLLRLGL